MGLFSDLLRNRNTEYGNHNFDWYLSKKARKRYEYVKRATLIYYETGHYFGSGTLLEFFERAIYSLPNIKRLLKENKAVDVRALAKCMVCLDIRMKNTDNETGEKSQMPCSGFDNIFDRKKNKFLDK